MHSSRQTVPTRYNGLPSLKNCPFPWGSGPHLMQTLMAVSRDETRRDMETRDRAKTRHASVETEPRPRHEKPCLETVSRRDTWVVCNGCILLTCLETPSLLVMVALCNRADHYIFMLFLLMAALCNRGGHYIFALWFLSSIVFFFLA